MHQEFSRGARVHNFYLYKYTRAPCTCTRALSAPKSAPALSAQKCEPSLSASKNASALSASISVPLKNKISIIKNYISDICKRSTTNRDIYKKNNLII